MRVKTGVYGYFAALLAAGALLGLLVREKLGVAAALPAGLAGLSEMGDGIALLRSAALLYVSVMKMPLLVFCTGFTVFAPAAASLAALYTGAALGSGWADLPPLRGAGGILAALIGAGMITLFLFLCGQAASHRLALRTAAPSARAMRRSIETRAYLRSFLLASALCLAAAGILALLSLGAA